MNESNFVDYVVLYCRSGKGGNGAIHFRREKYVPKGGPDGGDGGRGGNIIVKGNKNLWTLLHLKHTPHIIAGDGKDGSGNKKKGADGKDVIIEVPLGTIVKDFHTQEVELEITQDGEGKILLRGGRGGLGNERFKSSTNQTPYYAQEGEKGKEGLKIFELKILADVGLVGFPNAGKSTLLATLSAAKPKIADYPFTTLTPNVGIVKYKDYHSFVMADIPGIIEGAHQGKGLGLRFLRHIERNSILLFTIPINSQNIYEELKILRNEITKYNPELSQKKYLIAITKCDIVSKEELLAIKEKFSKENFIFISSFTKYGLNQLKTQIWKKLNE